MVGCLTFIPISCKGHKHATKNTYLIFQPVYMHWSMHINALKTQLMHKNVQRNPEKSQKFTQHSCCSMLTREIKLKAIRGNGYHFVHKGGTFPTEDHHACCEKLRFVRSIYPSLPQMGKNSWHVHASPC